MITDKFAEYALLITALTYINTQLAPMWKSLWQLIQRKLTYKVTIEETDELYYYFEKWLYTNYSTSYRNLEATINNKQLTSDYVSHSNKQVKTTTTTITDKLYTWQHEDFFIIYAGTPKRRLVITKGREKLEAAKSLKESYFNRFSIKGFGAKKSILSILKNVIEYNQQFKSEIQSKLYTSNSWGEWTNHGVLHGKNIDNLILDCKDELIKDVEDFINEEKWYNLRNIAYKRGYLLKGKPGNGKSALCQALALHTKRNIYYLSINDIDKDANLIYSFQNMEVNSILVIEDVDACYSDRDAVKTNVSFSTLLNCLDGVYSKYNIITIMTTNHADKLDPALIRAGRIDIQFSIDNPSKSSVQKYINNFFDSKIELKNYTDFKLPMVDIQNLCLMNKNNLNNVIDNLDSMSVNNFFKKNDRNNI
jgi:chaperone BCS1